MALIDRPVTFPTPRALSSGTAAKVTLAANNCAAGAINFLANGWPGTGPVTSWGGDLEAQVRPPAEYAFGLAVLLSQGVYDAAVSGQSSSVATASVVRYVDGLARTHTANGGTWGGDPGTYDNTQLRAWQSALWAATAAAAAALMWSQFNGTQRSQVQAMIAAEANRFLGYPTPSMRDRSGRVIYKGDTKAEEIVWNAFALFVAAAMMPSHSNASSWRGTALDMSIAANAVPSDVTSKRTLNGRRVRTTVTGSNLDLGGIVENHGYVHPNYSAAAGMTGLNGVIYAAISGANIPTATLHNLDYVYRGLTDVVFVSPPHASPGGTVYTPGSYAVYYPANDDGDPGRMASYVAMDCLAHCLNGDGRSTVLAATWADLHAQRQLDLQVTPGARRSSWDLFHAATGVLAHRLVVNRPSLAVDDTSY